MKTDKVNKVLMFAFIGVLLFVGVSLIINTSKSCDVHIDYDVTANSKANLTGVSLAEVKLACYKLCAEELRGDSYLMNNCFNKCEALE